MRKADISQENMFFLSYNPAMKENLDFFLLVFTSLFTMVNPFGVMPAYVSYTRGMNPTQSRQLALKASLTAFILMVLFTLTGQMIFRFFSISLDSLRVVGGVLFFVMGYDMIQAKIARTKDQEDDLVEEVDTDVAITPLGIPLLCGPGTITAVIIFNKQSPYLEQKLLLYSAMVANGIVIFFSLVSSKKIMSLLGESGNKVMFRIMGLIIMVIAVEFFFGGVRGLLRIT